MNIRVIQLSCFVIFLIICIFSCEESSNVSTITNDFPRDTISTAYVLFVYDGDTFRCKIDSKYYNVRLLNVDCFETSINDRLESQAIKAGIPIDSALRLGLDAKKFADSLLDDNEIVLWRKSTDKNVDVYYRLLRNLKVDGMSFDSLLKIRNLTVK